MFDHTTTLAEQHIVVFGGSAGIGLAVARQAHAQGARLTLVSSNQQRLDRALQQLPGARGQVLDLREADAVGTLLAQLGTIDHLVYTAGDALQLHPLQTLDMDHARRAFELRYWSALQVVKLAQAHMAPRGSIVLSGGIAGLRPHPGWSVVASVCGAIDALVRALAVELAPRRVNAVAPGLVDSSLWDTLAPQAREALYAEAAARLPVGAVGRVEEVADAYLMLMRCGYVTGQSLVIDGGALLV